jgi:predicted Fe-Mo cluster-binding NifX family protein
MPRFGCTREILIVTVENGKIISKKRLPVTQKAFFSLSDFLGTEQVSVMICGGIHPRFQQVIQAQKIELIWGVVGEWQLVFQAYLDGTLQSDPAFCLHHRHGRNSGGRFRGGQQKSYHEHHCSYDENER